MSLFYFFLFVLSKTDFAISQSSSSQGAESSTSPTTTPTTTTTRSTTTNPWDCWGCDSSRGIETSVVLIKLKNGGSCFGVAISTRDILTSASCVGTFSYGEQSCFSEENQSDYNVTILVQPGMYKVYGIESVKIHKNPVYLTGEGSIGILRIRPDPKIISEKMGEKGIGAETTTVKSGPPGIPVPNVACLHYGSRNEVGNKDALIATQPELKANGISIPTRSTKIDSFEKCTSRYIKMLRDEKEQLQLERDYFKKKFNVADLTKRFTLSDSAICSTTNPTDILKLGGPLFLNMGGKYQVAGVMEGPHSKSDNLVLYTLVTPYLSWILENSDAGHCQPHLPDNVAMEPRPTENSKLFQPCGSVSGEPPKKKSGARSTMAPPTLAAFFIYFKLFRIF